MFVVGIGDNVDRSELEKIASSPGNVFIVESYDELQDKPRQIRTGICIGIVQVLFLLLHIEIQLSCFSVLNFTCFIPSPILFITISHVPFLAPPPPTTTPIPTAARKLCLIRDPV